jgi:hypothetical protein
MKCHLQEKASKGEKALMAWLEEEGYEVERHNRGVLSGLEIDGIVKGHRSEQNYHKIYDAGKRRWRLD